MFNTAHSQLKALSKHRLPEMGRTCELASLPCCFNNLMLHWALKIHQYIKSARCKTECTHPVLLEERLPSTYVSFAVKTYIYHQDLGILEQVEYTILHVKRSLKCASCSYLIPVSCFCAFLKLYVNSTALSLLSSTLLF